jgi:hypothetical protein
VIFIFCDLLMAALPPSADPVDKRLAANRSAAKPPHRNMPSWVYFDYKEPAWNNRFPAIPASHALLAAAPH